MTQWLNMLFHKDSLQSERCQRLHARCVNHFASRRKKNLRNVGTYNFWNNPRSAHGMRSFGDNNFIIGERKWSQELGIYPEFDDAAMAVYGELKRCDNRRMGQIWSAHDQENIQYIPVFHPVFEKAIQFLPPTEQFSRVMFAVTPTKMYVPAHKGDGIRNNMFHGMGLAGLSTFTSRERSIPAKYGQVMLADVDETLVTGGWIIDTNSLETTTWGSAIPNAVGQVYASTIFERGMTAFRWTVKLLNLYHNRHHVMPQRTEPPHWYYRHRPWWDDDVMWDLYEKLNPNNLPPSPAELSDIMGQQPYRVNLASVRRHWMWVGLEYGFCRVVPKGTPVYTEYSPYQGMPEFNLNDIITSTN